MRPHHLAEPDPPPFDLEGAPARPTSTPDPALAELFRRHHRWLAGLLRLRYGRDLAEELVHETFLTAARVGVPDPLRHPKAWLMKVAVNAARQRHRHQTSHAPHASETLEEGHVWLRSDQDELVLLKQVIQALPPKFRDVFVLHRLEGLTYPEIAQRLRISTKTVEWRMSKALEICAARLRD